MSYSQIGKENNTGAFRWMAAISILPALFLPFYNQVLHGGRTAAEILPRSTAYAAAHILGAMCMFLAAFGLIALYGAFGKKLGKLGSIGFGVALLSQMMFAGNLLIDGFFNPLLAKFDPILQTQLHSSNFLQTASSHSNYLSGLLGGAYLFDPITGILYALGFILLGIGIFRSQVLPRMTGVLLAVGASLLSVAIMIPQWLESIGYGCVGLGIAWISWHVVRSNKEAA